VYKPLEGIGSPEINEVADVEVTNGLDGSYQLADQNRGVVMRQVASGTQGDGLWRR
jgi:hypothetical protein